MIYIVPILQVLAISVTEPTSRASATTRGSSPASPCSGCSAPRCGSASFTTAITLVLGYVVAYVLTHASPRAQRLMVLGVLLPLWMSVLVRAFAWVTLLRRQGLVNKALIGSG